MEVHCSWNSHELHFCLQAHPLIRTWTTKIRINLSFGFSFGRQIRILYWIFLSNPFPWARFNCFWCDKFFAFSHSSVSVEMNRWPIQKGGIQCSYWCQSILVENKIVNFFRKCKIFKHAHARNMHVWTRSWDPETEQKIADILFALFHFASTFLMMHKKMLFLLSTIYEIPNSLTMDTIYFRLWRQS